MDSVETDLIDLYLRISTMLQAFQTVPTTPLRRVALVVWQARLENALLNGDFSKLKRYIPESVNPVKHIRQSLCLV